MNTAWLLIISLPLLAPGGCGKQPVESPTASVPKAKTVPRPSPFENSLGMKFVPVNGTKVWFSIWETRAQDYAAFINSAPNAAKISPGAKTLHPITNVNWEDADAFCRWLTQHERALGKLANNEQYRLPTDREWDAAIGPTRYPWGPKWPPPKDKPFAFVPEGDDNTAPVGSFAPNAQGIYDLAGNAFEWVQDWYHAGMNAPDIRQENERLREDGGGRKYKVLRGASWVMHEPSNLLTGYHYINLPERRGALYGFRCVLEVAP